MIKNIKENIYTIIFVIGLLLFFLYIYLSNSNNYSCQLYGDNWYYENGECISSYKEHREVP